MFAWNPITSSLRHCVLSQEGAAVMGPISPARVRRAIEATCLKVGEGKDEDALTYGAGLIQVWFTPCSFLYFDVVRTRGVNGG